MVERTRGGLLPSKTSNQVVQSPVELIRFRWGKPAVLSCRLGVEEFGHGAFGEVAAVEDLSFVMELGQDPGGQPVQCRPRGRCPSQGGRGYRPQGPPAGIGRGGPDRRRRSAPARPLRSATRPGQPHPAAGLGKTWTASAYRLISRFCRSSGGLTKSDSGCTPRADTPVFTTLDRLRDSAGHHPAACQLSKRGTAAASR